MNKTEAITLLASIIGAAAWAPWVYDQFFQEPQLEARFLSIVVSQDMRYDNYDIFNNSDITLQGIEYVPKITIVSLKKNFNVKRVEVLIKYPGERELRNGTIVYMNDFNMNITGIGNGTLKIPPSEHILSLIVLENGKPASVYVPFIVNRSTNIDNRSASESWKPISVLMPFIDNRSINIDNRSANNVNRSANEKWDFEFIEFRFYEYDGSMKPIKIDKKDIDVKNMYFDEKYWEPAYKRSS